MGDIRYINPSHYKSMKWKNGLGSTLELAREDHGRGFTDGAFLWRISIADVDEDGPFSIFPNIDRHLMLLDGNGISLDGGDAGIGVLYTPMQVYGFPGDIDLEGRLSSGPIRNLNLMFDRRFMKGELSGFYADAPQRVMLKSDIHFIHLVEGSAPVTIDVNGELRTLKAGASMRFEDVNCGVTIMPMGEGSLRSGIAFISLDKI